MIFNLKLFTAVLIFFLVENTLHAQSDESPQTTVSAGYGLGPSDFSGVHAYLEDVYRTYSPVYERVSGPLYLKLEYAPSTKISLGLNFSTSKYHIKYSTNWHSPGGLLLIDNLECDFKTYSILGRINYYFFNSSDFELYTGCGVGFRNNSFSATPPESSSVSLSPICLELTLGGRLLLSKHVGIFSEIGYSESIMQIGLCGRF
jgi:hypothetical protein